jgi:hypothetical protein
MAGGDYELLGGFWPGGPLCFVEFEDFAGFAMYWRDSGSDLPGDLYKDGAAQVLRRMALLLPVRLAVEIAGLVIQRPVD